MNPVTPQRSLDEVLNALTHGIGAAIALAAAAVLITLAAVFGDAYAIVGSAIYGTSLLLLYVASTLYHAAHDGVAKQRLKIFDHCMIYVLIAGTYTPFTLTSLRGPWGYSLLAIIWTLALCGIVFKLRFAGRFKGLSTAIYIAMGWLVIVAIQPLMMLVPRTAVWWLIAGGLAYTIGVVFYLSKRWPYAHTVWHAFVLAGSVCHFAAVLIQVLASSSEIAG